MGTAIAERLLAAGHQVTVYNRTAARAQPLLEQGAGAAATPAQLWDSAEVVIAMVADSAALETLALGSDGLVCEAARGRLLIEMSTVSSDASARVGEAAAAVGLAYLRAPVSGNPAVLRAGNLGIMASGERATFDSAEALLREIGPNVFYLGDGEAARTMKLAVNLLIAGTAQLLAECLCLGEANGLERQAMLEVLAGSAVGSPFVKVKSKPLVENDYSSTFSTRLMLKDLKLALASGEEAGVPLPTTAVISQLLQGCISSGMGDIDFTALLPRLQRESGVDIAALGLGR
jgi:3-hydroxyisobutyrate dehydrogenase-like beta-hydroxyacid dehydrogenase